MTTTHNMNDPLEIRFGEWMFRVDPVVFDRLTDYDVSLLMAPCPTRNLERAYRALRLIKTLVKSTRCPENWRKVE